jgi:hypothetical protein
MASNHFNPSPDAFASQSNEQRTSSSEPSASGYKKERLQDDFQPSEYSVLCGRGKESFNHAGNRRFRTLASMFIDRYSQADTKAAKTAIVSEIITVIRQAGGNFCKYYSKCDAWFEVGDHHAREKVSGLLRDLLHTQYRSSAKAKVGRRKKTLKQKQHLKPKSLSGQKRVEGTEDSDDLDESSTTSSCWGQSKDSLGFEYWLEESDDFFDINVF